MLSKYFPMFGQAEDPGEEGLDHVLRSPSRHVVTNRLKCIVSLGHRHLDVSGLHNWKAVCSPRVCVGGDFFVFMMC